MRTKFSFILLFVVALFTMSFSCEKSDVEPQKPISELILGEWQLDSINCDDVIVYDVSDRENITKLNETINYYTKFAPTSHFHYVDEYVKLFVDIKITTDLLTLYSLKYNENYDYYYKTFEFNNPNGIGSLDVTPVLSGSVYSYSILQLTEVNLILRHDQHHKLFFHRINN